MVVMEANDGVIFFKPLECSQLDTVVDLYNSSGDIRYATGVAAPISSAELGARLSRLEASKNEFIAGIFIMNTNHSAIKEQLRLAGVVSGVLQDKAIWIKLMAVLPQFRQIGIGSRSARLLLRHGKTCCGISEAFLSVMEKNAVGIRFWLGQGFSEAGRFNKTVFGGEQLYKVIIMHKRL